MTGTIPLERKLSWTTVVRRLDSLLQEDDKLQHARDTVTARYGDIRYFSHLVVCERLNMAEETYGRFSVEWSADYLERAQRGPEHIVRPIADDVDLVVRFDNEEDSILFKLRWM
jgi:hypothetical protein